MNVGISFSVKIKPTGIPRFNDDGGEPVSVKELGGMHLIAHGTKGGQGGGRCRLDLRLSEQKKGN